MKEAAHRMADWIKEKREGENNIILSVVSVSVVCFGKDTTHAPFITGKVKSQVCYKLLYN